MAYHCHTLVLVTIKERSEVAHLKVQLRFSVLIFLNFVAGQQNLSRSSIFPSVLTSPRGPNNTHGSLAQTSNPLPFEASIFVIVFLIRPTDSGVQHYKQKKKDILWSYRLRPSAKFPAHSALTPTEMKKAAKHLVDTILKVNSHGLPRLSSDSPEFIGDPDSVSISITSRVEVGGLMCPCNANLNVDREKGLIHTELMI
ncbi:hypothetical protein C8J55DRAFT_488616 [Lentinula edodes]|uniref:Uncharacterized protein n=1 Tax=Lentinula lateritia TaxID=40482 RepID=A0A9W9AF15_9AGAR|nr:hypothetical protein C8J55DRAFT_488616 [Lentinula edodes]